jgi:hypothetical protein
MEKILRIIQVADNQELLALAVAVERQVLVIVQDLVDQEW